MTNLKILNIEGALLNKQELYEHLEKVASTHNVKTKSDKRTYPIPRLLENYSVIKEVYNLLNEHVKLKITIQPAGEWLLDNFYAIEEVTKSIEKEMTIKKYTDFVGIANGKYQGFARVYVVASEIVNYTDNKITREVLENCLQAYQTKKNLSMDEIWNIGTFMQIAIIENIRQIAEAIYVSQMEKFKVESIVERLIDNKPKQEQKYENFRTSKNFKVKSYDLKYPFVEYMSYKLKKHGKKTESFLKILEEEVEKTGSTVSDIIKREHFDIAIKKISIGNSITSIKKIQRINFLEIFERINSVEEILRADPASVYDKMDYKTKEDYRNKIKEISKTTKISEMYIAKKLLELASNAEKGTKQAHIGYYLMGENVNILYNKLQYNENKVMSKEKKTKMYICFICILTIIFSGIIARYYPQSSKNMWIKIISFLMLLLPISELIIQITQYILSKIVKPKLIPKLDFYNGIPKEESTFVVIPTIINSKEKVIEMFRKLEVDYLANISKNLYFCLLGDCKESTLEEESYDKEVIKAGLEEVRRLNQKYGHNQFPIFHFIYRRRMWNESEESYLGWERKRGALTDFTEFLLGNMDSQEELQKFNINTLDDYKNNIPKIKYIITLDSDTDLSLNSAFELIGSMAHILNKPEIQDGKVINGYGLIQPRVGINLDVSYKSLFTEIFAGSGGVDSYSNAISDIYQDNFGEGIFTGKGIFDLNLYSKILKNEIPENTVLSHDLLEGSYLRCGLASDILIMDGYPCKYTSFISRLSRWIRGDWQIIGWLRNKKLNLLSKYKIFDNLRRSLFEISVIVASIYFLLIGNIYNVSTVFPITILAITSILPFILEILNSIIFKKDGEQKQNTFTPKIAGIQGAVYRGILTFASLPYKAWTSLKAICKTLYRLIVTRKHMLEWMTSEEAEKNLKGDIVSYYKAMVSNVVLGIIALIYFLGIQNIVGVFVGILLILAPALMCFISKEIVEKNPKGALNKEEIKYIENVGKKTFDFFYDNLTEQNNYLIPDNYQEDRKNLYVDRTSSTNIGLSVLAVMAGVDLGYIDLEKGLELLKNIIETVKELKKWNGHLYNWYNIKTKEPLIPRYISTVDSGNFVGYLYVTKAFLEEQNREELKTLIENVNNLIDNTDFSKLYSKEHRLFSIGFNIEENKLTDSYYDLLASEARQASLVAIIKRDVELKHWNSLSRTLTILNNKKGLISWSGTAFEYLMPNINIPRFKGSLIDESIKFAEMCQIEYARALGTPWGISEAAFNVKDLHSNYQYKAFGIPWLGLKRGLADEIVIASYASVLAITDKPKEVVKNLKELEKYGMYNKYGFYESLDFSPQRLRSNEVSNVVKTYMAHHQALILLSINNLLNNNIFQKRFMQNPEVEAASILLQERMPETFIVTKEEKEKPERQKYQDYENYSVVTYKKIDEKLIRSNVISNGSYTVAINQKSQGFSKFQDIYVNRFKKTADYNQGIFIYIKNIENQKIMTVGEDETTVSFMPDQVSFEKNFGYIKTNLKITIDPEEAVEIRCLEIENIGKREENLEITAMLEPILSKREQDYAHPAFNNLFLLFDYDNENNILEVKRKKRNIGEEDIYLETALLTDCETIVDNEFEIDKEKLNERGNLGLPLAVEKSLPFSKKLGLVTEPMISLRKTIKIGYGEKKIVSLIMSVNQNKDIAVQNLKKYKNLENIKRAFEISKAKAEAESRYLDIKATEMNLYQKVLGYILFDNPLRSRQIKKINISNSSQSDLWKYGISGDLIIILVKIRDSNDIYVIKQVLKMYEFFRSKNIKIDLLFLDEEKHSYENYVREEIESQILDRHLSFLKNLKGGIYVLSKNEMPKKDIDLINFLSTFTIDTHLGDLRHLIYDLEEEYFSSVQNVPEEYFDEDIEKCNFKSQIDILKNEDNKYNNGYGAFSSDGKEYLIKVNKQNRLPTVWSNILANENFGTLVTENMGGYTWYKNSRLNRVSSWSNGAFSDIPSEIIYMEDSKTGKKWSLGLNPMPDENDYSIIYGFGFAKYIHECLGITQELEIFVPNEDSIKINILRLSNNTVERKKLKIVYYIKSVLGEDEIKSNGCIKVNYDDNSNMIFAENLYESDFKNKVYVSSSEKIKSFTGDKKAFLGKGGISNPDGLRKVRLNNSTGFGATSCIAIQIEVEIDSMSTKEIVLNLGACDNIIDGKNISYKYSKIPNCRQELEAVKRKWKDILERFQVYTPIESINIMLNGWCLYQTISSRLYGRTGFYQSGGAYGFRDQLQDTLCLNYIEPEKVKEEIIRHSKHQFIEGDVEHWWHEETSRGIRTRFSDDLLWLAFVTEEYIETTGDIGILDIKTPYLQGKVLEDNEEERYDLYKESNIQETIYEHCIRAIEKSLNFGEHGIPKIGTGDWNDGFSTVGNKGKGESVWLGFFLYIVINRFLPFIEKKGEEDRVNRYKNILQNLRLALNKECWDGRWFRRAYMDDGNILGSIENEECRIDSIAQSWSVISGVGDEDKKLISMESLENHLVDKENGIIKLLDPPFSNGKLEPGYIKSYLPGVRENGGQYTHSSLWVVIAEAMLGFGDKAGEFYRIINPIEHARTKEAANKYKVEPYVVAADVYGASNLVGRGGWTWYTGSSSWFYKAGVEYILGFKIENNVLRINPCIPRDWKEFSMRYRFGRSIYNIKVKNLQGRNYGVSRVLLNGEVVEDKAIRLVDDGRVNEVEVEM